MRHSIFLFAVFLFAFILYSSCKPDPYIVENKNIKGYVIGKETCNTDESNDYWLIDFTYGTNNLHVGDSLFFNGTTYTNVLKTKGLSQQLKSVGLRVSIDYNSISANKISTTGCAATPSFTFLLKEVIIKNQFEIR